MDRIKKFFPAIAVIAVLGLFLLLGSGSWLMARKVIAHLILPAGFLWVVGFGALMWPGISWKPRLLVAILWVTYSLAGSPYLGNWLMSSLEKPYLGFEQPEEKFDAVVLLGGGTVRTPGGRAALGANGDRVLKPLLLYHDGLVNFLITTGRGVTEVGDDRLFGKETSEIWGRLGVPNEVVFELNDPRNTSEEMAAVAKLLSDHPEWKRIGLTTSASHMRRAMQLAQAQGLELIPVPSNFRSSQIPFSTHYLIPQGKGFRDVQTALWEYLGALL